MGEVVRAEFGRKEDIWLTKQQLQKLKDRSKRWVEQRVAEGMPSRFENNRRIFRLSDVDHWLEERSRKKAKPGATGSTAVNERLVALERRVGELEQQQGEDGRGGAEPPAA